MELKLQLAVTVTALFCGGILAKTILAQNDVNTCELERIDFGRRVQQGNWNDAPNRQEYAEQLAVLRSRCAPRILVRGKDYYVTDEIEKLSAQPAVMAKAAERIQREKKKAD